MTFDEAFEKLIAHEGGYVNDPRDPGGETKFGISKRSYPHEDIKALTLARAKEIYHRDFWAACGIDGLPPAARFDVFDTAVNSGRGTAIRLMQKALNVAEDGRIGPITMNAIVAADESRFVARFGAHRLLFFASLSTFATFGRGWTRRAAENILLGVPDV
jgi:lysozyme family protein